MLGNHYKNFLTLFKNFQFYSDFTPENSHIAVLIGHPGGAGPLLEVVRPPRMANAHCSMAVFCCKITKKLKVLNHVKKYVKRD